MPQWPEQFSAPLWQVPVHQYVDVPVDVPVQVPVQVPGRGDVCGGAQSYDGGVVPPSTVCVTFAGVART